MRKSLVVVVYAVAACTLIMGLSETLHADIINTTGQVSIISPPADARVNLTLESDTIAPLFTRAPANGEIRAPLPPR